MLSVEDRAWRSNLPQAFIDAGLQLGYNQVDINGANQTGKCRIAFLFKTMLTNIEVAAVWLPGFTVPQVTSRNGARCSAYTAFLENIANRPNLKILTHALVEKILIDDSNRAYAVQYRRGSRTVVSQASREIILSAGVIGSPHILMLSGIGHEHHLKQFGVKFQIPIGCLNDSTRSYTIFYLNS